MSPEAQRIAIAEACGWTCFGMFNGRSDQPATYAPNHTSPQVLPDYLSDLNAMHEAEKVLSSKYEPAKGESQWLCYLEWLGYCGDTNCREIFGCVHATAAQRAEAFLRTLGKWGESP